MAQKWKSTFDTHIYLYMYVCIYMCGIRHWGGFFYDHFLIIWQEKKKKQILGRGAVFVKPLVILVISGAKQASHIHIHIYRKFENQKFEFTHLIHVSTFFKFTMFDDPRVVFLDLLQLHPRMIWMLKIMFSNKTKIVNFI